MGREIVMPGVDRRARAKFSACCGCCRMFVDRFGSVAYEVDQNGLASYTRKTGEVGNGWITAKGNCVISPVGASSSVSRNLKMSGPDCMLVRDMRVDDFTINYIADYISGGFTLGSEYDPIDEYIVFHPEKEHRFIFNWVDENNFDFISYWDWNLLNDYTISKVGIRENGSERFILPTHYGLPANGHTYLHRTIFRKFCYIDDVIFIDIGQEAGVVEYPGYSITYQRPMRSRMCGIGTGPSFSGDWHTNLFAVSKTITEEQRRKNGYGLNSNHFDGAWEDCKWCPRPINGCSNYVVPSYISAERFDDNGVSKYVVNLGNLGNNGIYGQYFGGSNEFIGVNVSVDPDYILQGGFFAPNPTAGTVRVGEYSLPLFSAAVYKFYVSEATQIRDDCDAWNKLRIDPAPDYHPPELDTTEPDGHWELTGVYEL